MEDRKRILDMLAQGKITAEDAAKLLDAVGGAKSESVAPSAAPEPGKDPKYLRVIVESAHSGKGKETVNVRVPFQLLRAGVKLAALIPGGIPNAAKEAMKENGVNIEWDRIKAGDLEEVIAHLSALEVDVNNESEKVRVFCEW